MPRSSGTVDINRSNLVASGFCSESIDAWDDFVLLNGRDPTVSEIIDYHPAWALDLVVNDYNFGLGTYIISSPGMYVELEDNVVTIMKFGPVEFFYNSLDETYLPV